ncbi:hypothetical protein DXG01_001480 [Tephrocybe rancida]|nr:hypothetical protein DXG01_001480 [Tephrocybe rancida]
MLVSHHGKELNEGQTKGDRLSLSEIQSIVQQEIEDGEHNDVDEVGLQEELKDSREVKSKGMRSLNRAVAVDYNASLWWVETEGSLVFVNEVLEITPTELVRKFELWACSKDRKKIVGISNITMHYEKYESDVVERYSVILHGWLLGIKFRSPAKITSMEEARVLWDALASSECKWVKLSCKEKDTHAKERQQKIASGEIPVKTRQLRSDKGKKRGPKKSKVGEKRKRGQGNNGEASEGKAEHNKENAPPQKKQCGTHTGKSSAARSVLKSGRVGSFARFFCNRDRNRLLGMPKCSDCDRDR